VCTSLRAEDRQASAIATMTSFDTMLDKDRGYVACLSGPMHRLETAMAEIASTDIPLLLVGESGTGKEMLAHRIHRMSRRAALPIKKIACASMNSERFLPELGFKANGNGRRARAKDATPGTLFFDEIGELESSCQRILLSALPDGDASQYPHAIRSRVISTTSRSIDEDVRCGQFRSELYYRIRGARLHIPPLREHKEDILPLVEAFLTKHATQLQRPRISLSERALQTLFDYSWPGNIRELENVIKEVVALGDEHLVLSMLSENTSSPRQANSGAPMYSLKAAARAASREAEKELILKALARTHWNRKRAAHELQISYKSLLYKLKQISFSDPKAGQE
jgi:two-component system, NtrC family, response regulator AtoC